MTSEKIKDIRLMLELISKDYERLSTDMKVLSEFLMPIQKELQEKEKKE